MDFDPSDTGEMILQTADGDQDGYLAKYSLTGECLWARPLPEWYMVQGIATQEGDVYVVGADGGNPGSMGIVKFSAEGVVRWTRTIGTGLPDALALYRPEGSLTTHIYVSGDTFSRKERQIGSWNCWSRRMEAHPTGGRSISARTLAVRLPHCRQRRAERTWHLCALHVNRDACEVGRVRQ